MINTQQIFEFLACSDLKSIDYNQQLIKLIATEEDFDMLFSSVFHHNRLMMMRAVDAVEKISLLHPFYLHKHKTAILHLCEQRSEADLACHLAALAARLPFSKEEVVYVFDLFRSWVINAHENKIVRVNALQTLYELTKQDRRLKPEFERILLKIEKENIAPLRARVKKLRKMGL